MHVLHELVCGIRGAEDGTVDIYRRGTSTRVTYYTSFEGGGATTPSSATTLDSNGGGEFYVNETVDVVVRDSGGVEVRRFTSAPAASAVEVISQSFTGTDYESAATGASKPLALSAALDMLYTSFGARDFNVLFGGASTSLQTAIAGVGTLFYNVKSPAYGAVGNGTTNDASAIQAALTAAGAAGAGVVFFPAGTYNISSTTLSVPANVSLLGQGPGVSVITPTVDSGSGAISFAASGTYVQTIEGLRITPTVAFNRNLIIASNGSLVLMRNCVIGNSNAVSIAVVANSASSQLFFEHTTIAGNPPISVQCPMRMYNCKVVLPATFNSTAIASVNGGYVLIGVTFDSSSMSAGTGVLHSLDTASGGKECVIIGCRCANPAGGTLSVTAGPGANSAGADGGLEIGCIWGSALTRGVYGASAIGASYTGSYAMERERRRYYVASNAAGISVSALEFASAEVVRTNNGAQTVTLDGPGPVNCDFTLVYWNNHGAGGGTITMAGNVKGLTTFTVNASSVSYFFFKSVHLTTSKYWVLVDSTENLTP